MKVVLRADDVGYMHVYNLGTFKTIDEGITTHCDVMLDGFGATEALAFLRERPWISVGWHTHFACKPVLNPAEIPSCVLENGRLRGSISHFHEPPETKDIKFEEMYKECIAELERCKDILGRYPDNCAVGNANSPIAKAVLSACDDKGIPHGFLGGFGPSGAKPVADRYKHLNFKEHYMRGKTPNLPDLRVWLYQDYDPAAAIIETMPKDDDNIYEIANHPGFLDDIVLQDNGTHCSIHRVKDVEAYQDPRLYAWIKENKIELLNRNDVLNGSHDYQEHLKKINSPLWLGNYL